MNYERQAFEAWCAQQYPNTNMARCSDGYAHTAAHRVLPITYANVQMLWEAWQAARAASPVPAGWKLVPVEPTKEMLAAGDKIMDCDPQWVARGYRAMLAASPASPAAVEMSPEFTDTSRAALAWVLWHHQGASSEIGQAMRFALGMGRTERLSERQVAEAKRWAAIAAQPPTPQPPQGAQQEPVATK
jgi:hypothetical protein